MRLELFSRNLIAITGTSFQLQALLRLRCLLIRISLGRPDQFLDRSSFFERFPLADRLGVLRQWPIGLLLLKASLLAKVLSWPSAGPI